LLEVEFFGSLKLLNRTINLGFLSYAIFVIETRLTFQVGAQGKKTYGVYPRGDITLQLEAIQMWLMDPVRCPTSWGEPTI